MWLKTKIISSGNAPKKSLRDYLPKLAPEQRAESERRLYEAGIVRTDKNNYNIYSDTPWALFLANYQVVINIKEVVGPNFQYALFALAEIIWDRPDLIGKMDIFIEPFSKLAEASGKMLGEMASAFYFLRELVSVRPDLAEKIDMFTVPLGKHIARAGTDTQTSLLELIKTCPNLAEKLNELVKIVEAAQRGSGDLCNTISQIIVLCPELANKIDSFVLLAQKFGETTAVIYGILFNMLKEKLLAEDNIDQVVRELIRDGEKALQRMKEQVNVA